MPTYNITLLKNASNVAPKVTEDTVIATRQSVCPMGGETNRQLIVWLDDQTVECSDEEVWDSIPAASVSNFSKCG